MTRWPRYLAGFTFDEVAPLAAPAHLVVEPLLVEFAESLDRVVEQAYRSVCDDKVNAFDQVRINSFVRYQRPWGRALLVKLQKGTFRSYKLVWQRLICFAYRSAHQHPPAPPARAARAIDLPHRLT